MLISARDVSIWRLPKKDTVNYKRLELAESNEKKCGIVAALVYDGGTVSTAPAHWQTRPKMVHESSSSISATVALQPKLGSPTPEPDVSQVAHTLFKRTGSVAERHYYIALIDAPYALLSWPVTRILTATTYMHVLPLKRGLHCLHHHHLHHHFFLGHHDRRRVPSQARLPLAVGRFE